MNTLVLPISSLFFDEDIAFYRRYSTVLIGASSDLENAPNQFFDEVIRVPPVTDPMFMDKLENIVRNYAITNIVSRHPYVYAYLEKNLENLPYQIELDSMSTQEILVEKYGKVCGLQETIKSKIGESRYSIEMERFLVPSIMRIEKVYGESSLDKVIKLAEIVSDLNLGDIVEVGVFFGKSGYALSEFSSIFCKGNVLLVDSWDAENSIQFSRDGSLAQLSRSWDWDLVFNSFLVNMNDISRNHNFNYLKKTSKEASHIYKQLKRVTTAEFGTVNYLGSIALLHVDANHDYLSVKSDIESWVPLVQNDGWVIFDDYEWALGDGVKRAVDEYISRNPDKIQETFKFGKSLVMRINNV
jgi:hypothetical protein